MLFSSYEFIFMFLPIVLVVFFGLNFAKVNKVAQQIFLIAVSLYFYYKGCGNFIVIFIAQILFNYIIGTLLLRIKANKIVRLIIMWVALAENVGILFYYKYTYFFANLSNKLFNSHFSMSIILLPLGISFFTFRIISYIVDCYNRKAEHYTLIEYLLFITFFPALTIGPIVRHNEIIPQFKDNKIYKFDLDNFKKGIFIFSIGLSKKVLIATPLLSFTNNAFNINSNHNPLILWIGMFTNLFAFYFDFSGYTDMAIGISRFFNIELVENFNSPYKARNIQDYWRRWHITLTRFLTDYIFSYIYKPGSGIAIFCLGTMITFLISGFWHGAGINYIIWGLLHGLSMCIIALLALKSSKKYLMNKKAARFITMAALTFLASLYATDGLRNYYKVLKTLVNFNYFKSLGLMGSAKDILLTISSNSYTIIILLLSVYICFYTSNTKELTKKFENNSRYPIYAGILMLLSLFGLGATSSFIYFKF